MREKILIVAPAWLGDMIMAHTMIRTLHSQDHEIHVLAVDWVFAVIARMPEVSQCISLPITHGEFKLAARYQLGKQLRAEKYDRAIVSPNSFKSALIPFFAKIPVRTGWIGECRFGLLSDWRYLDKKALPRMVQRYAALALPKGAALDKDTLLLPKLQVDATTVAKTLKKFNLNADKKILALSPGAAFGRTKQWPTSYFAEIANEKLDASWQVWLFGSPNDKPVTDDIMQKTQGRSQNLSGRLELFETVDLMSMAAGLVSNDSGLLHVAAALDIPVIGIYGSTSPDFTPPLGEKSRTLQVADMACRPCFERTCRYSHLHCLTQILPSEVRNKMNDLGL